MITLFVVGIVISNTVLVTLYWVIMQLYYINLDNKKIHSPPFPTSLHQPVLNLVVTAGY